MKRKVLAAITLALAFCQSWAGERQPVTGLVLKVDRTHGVFVVSCDGIPGYMEPMVMSFSVRKPEDLRGVEPSTMVQFVLINDRNAMYAENLKVRNFDSADQEPQEAQRLKLLQSIGDQAAPVTAIARGELVPDFEFSDQTQRKVALSQFSGEVVVLTFIYTRCPNPNYCFRLNSNLARLQKRFRQRLGQDLVLLSLVVDPEHDLGDRLTNYANIWRANPQAWHFLTGSLPEIQKVTNMFGMNFWSGEGVVTHSFHTIVIDRQRKLGANLEGNQFTAQQLGDLVESMLAGSN